MNNVKGDKRDRQNFLNGLNLENFVNGLYGCVGINHIDGTAQGIGKIGDGMSDAHFIKATEYQSKSRITQFSNHQQ